MSCINLLLLLCFCLVGLVVCFLFQGLLSFYTEQLNTLAVAQFIFSVKLSHRNELTCLEQDFYCFYYFLRKMGGVA